MFVILRFIVGCKSTAKKSDRSHVVLWAKELLSRVVFLRPLGLRLIKCSICSFQCNNWNDLNEAHYLLICYNTHFLAPKIIKWTGRDFLSKLFSANVRSHYFLLLFFFAHGFFIRRFYDGFSKLVFETTVAQGYCFCFFLVVFYFLFFSFLFLP